MASNTDIMNTSTMFSPRSGPVGRLHGPRKPLAAIDVNKKQTTATSNTGVVNKVTTSSTLSMQTASKLSSSYTKKSDRLPKSKPSLVSSKKERFEEVWRTKTLHSEWTRDDFLFGVELGHGGMSVVYKAIEKQSRYEVAIKVQQASTADGGSDNDDVITEFELHQTLYHPNILNVIDSFYHLGSVNDDDESNDKYLYVIMELCVDGTLNDKIQNSSNNCSGGLRESQAAKYFMNMIDAVEYIHEMELIHCDIKPANFLVDPHNQVKLADFGMALSGNIHGQAIIGGTTSYMAPEFLTAWEHGTDYFDSRNDIYSLGVALYEMLLGFLPYDCIEDDNSPLLDSATELSLDLEHCMANLNIENDDANDQQGGDGDNEQSVVIEDEDDTPILDLRKLYYQDPYEPFQVPKPVFIEDISVEGKDLVRRLMEPFPDKRITISEAKQHQWFQKFGLCESPK